MSPRRQLDIAAAEGDAVVVELQSEAGVPGSSKVYVHVSGQTLFRLCKVYDLQVADNRPSRVLLPFRESEVTLEKQMKITEEMREWLDSHGHHGEEREAMIRETWRRGFEGARVYVNGAYQVWVKEVPSLGDWPAMVHLSIRREDREPIRDWRELQQIKNALVGPENEAVELFPSESRLLDTSNQYHLWVLKDTTVRFPFGWEDRHVTTEPFGASRQRAFAPEAEESPLPDSAK